MDHGVTMTIAGQMISRGKSILKLKTKVFGGLMPIATTRALTRHRSTPMSLVSTNPTSLSSILRRDLLSTSTLCKFSPMLRRKCT